MSVPTVHAVLVVDIESYGPRPNPFQASLRRAMYDVLREACADAGMDWESIVHLDRGDGVILLVPAATSIVTVAGPFLRDLDAVLAEKAAMFSRAHRMRLRVGLHQGLCQRDDTGWMGEAINTACRLVDAQPLRDALAAASDARMAVIVSDEIYQTVIRHGYRQMDPASFAPITLAAKELTGATAWISVPGRSYPAGLGAARPGPAGARDRRAAADVPAAAPGPAPDAGTVAGRMDIVQRGGIANYGSTTVQGDQFTGDKYVAGNGNAGAT